MPVMKGIAPSTRCLGLAAASAALLWLAQPPLGWWPLAFVALVPWLALAEAESLPKYRWLWLASAIYWLVSLQGLRHAHPLMFVPWIALGLYLGIYVPLFVAVTRRLRSWGVPLALAAGVSWVGWECVRNYAVTGISVLMLGHSLAPRPELIQVADLLGSYGVSLVAVVVNVAALQAWRWWRGKAGGREFGLSAGLAAGLLIASVAYGRYRLEQPVGESLVTVALIQRDEQTEYVQDRERESEIFRNYARESLKALREAEQPVDAVVWPESMLTGGLPWMEWTSEARPPEEWGVPANQFESLVRSNQGEFLRRLRDFQRVLEAENEGRRPDVIGGCGVVRYSRVPEVFSGIVHLDGEPPDAGSRSPVGWYGKTHLVMFGEYIPLVGSIPGLGSLVPEGMGLQTGRGPTRFGVGQAELAPNICIETAVERITVNHLRRLLNPAAGASLPDAVVTVTNDAWFDGSSVVAHHLRCAQLVAAGIRRPVLSAANGGPTAWIDSSGRVVETLPFGADGVVVARPQEDSRLSLYVRIGDVPAKVLAAVCLLVSVHWVLTRLAGRRQRRRDEASRGSLAET